VTARVGFVGLGNMGSALALRLAAADGVRLAVFDLDETRCRKLVAAGAIVAQSPRDLAAMSDVVLTCLPTSEHVRSVLFDDRGLAEGLAAGALVIDCTSGHPEATREIAAQLATRAVALVDAPVSGGPQGAAAGTIALLAGGTAEDVARANAVLSLISPNVRHVGPIGAGHTVKLLNNVLAAGHRMLAFEMAAVAAANGVDPRTFVEAVNISSGRSYATEVTMPRHVFGEQLVQGFTLGLMTKDVRLGTSLIGPGFDGLSLAREVGRRLDSALERYGPDTDVNQTLALYEEAAGRTVATSQRGEG
jgi:3-hydroxyisobutyrate dehydrogenase